MSEASTLSIKPIIHYPRTAQIGKTYLMTIDLQTAGEFIWHYDEEEYSVYCRVYSEFFSSKPIGEPIVVLHRFGGNYGKAAFLLTPNKGSKISDEKINILFINSWGVPVKNITLYDIKITKEKVQGEKVRNWLISNNLTAGSQFPTADGYREAEPTKFSTTAAASALTKIAVEIFQNINRGFLERLRNGGDVQTQALISQASKKYANGYRQRHGYLKILSMRKPTDLESVYTSIRLFDMKSSKAESLKELQKVYLEQRRRLNDFEKNAKLGVDWARTEQYLMVLGGPGTGKSTFLRKMGLEALKGNRGGLKHRCIPVFIELKRLTVWDTVEDINIKKNIVKEFEICGFPRAADFTDHALRQGKLLILLDGLDEVPCSTLQNIIQAIQEFINQYEANRYIISCRTGAYLTSFQQFTEVAVVPEFYDAQIQQFIKNWFSSNEDKNLKSAESFWMVLQQSENEWAKELATNPLTLIFLCLVYDKAQDLPKNRAILYKKLLSILLAEWSAEKRIMRSPIYEGLSTELEENLLAEIAYTGFNNQQIIFTRQELSDVIKAFLIKSLNAPRHLDGGTVLNAILLQQGIFIEQINNAFMFSHRSLQEYLTAQFIVEHQQIEQLVKAHLFDSYWREVFLFTSGLMRTADDLFLLIEKQARKQISIPKLRSLLLWANRIIQKLDGKYKLVDKRVLVLCLATNLNSSSPQSIQAYVSDLIRDLDFDFNSSHAKVYSLNLAYKLQDLEVLQPEISSALIRSLEENDSSHKYFAASSTEDIKRLWLSALQIDSELLNLSEQEKQLLSNYFYANKLLVRCMEASASVRKSTYKKIEARMFTI